MFVALVHVISTWHGAAQRSDPQLVALIEVAHHGGGTDFSMNDKGIFWYRPHFCVPDVEDLRKELLEDAYYSWYIVHQRGAKMYHDLRKHFWYIRMKQSPQEINFFFDK